MKLLGIDYGRKKIGLSMADGLLAEPLTVIRVDSIEGAARKIAKVVEAEKVEKVIIGISEGAMAEETMKFVSAIRSTLSRSDKLRLSATHIETFDETLTTQNAQKMAIAAGIPRARRKLLEDAFAATVMLQEYIDSHT